MQLIKIAWRNLSRNKVRTFIAILAIITVVIIVVFARGLMVGAFESSFKMYIDNNFGHVRIIDKEYEIREVLLPLDYPVDGFNSSGVTAMMSEIKKLDKVEHLLPRIRFVAISTIDDDLFRMIGVGIDPLRENVYGSLPGDIIRGRMPESGNEILVGQGLLEALGVDFKDRVTLVFSDAQQSIRGYTFEIVGIRESGVAALDDNFFYLPLETAQDILWLEDEVSELLVFASSSRE